MTFQFNHICSNVRNMDASIAFYTNVLGGQVTSYQIIESNKAKYVYIQILDQLIELIEPGVHDENTQYGPKHIAFETDDIDEAYKYLTDLGYVFHIAPKPAASGNGRLAFFKDANGVVVEILQRDRTMYREPVDTPVLCSFDHYAVRSFDLAAAHKLYHEHLGMGNLAHFVIGDNIREIMYLNHGASVLEIVQSDAYKPTENPHSHIAFRSKDLKKTCAALRERGYDVSDDVISEPGMKTGLTFSIKDPDGTRVEFVDRPDLTELEAHGITCKTLSTLRPF